MAKDTTFQLDITEAGLEILQDMAMSAVDQSASAIASRAQSISDGMGSGIIFGVNSKVGVIKRGSRAIAIVAAAGVENTRDAYVSYISLLKGRDAGNVK